MNADFVHTFEEWERVCKSRQPWRWRFVLPDALSLEDWDKLHAYQREHWPIRYFFQQYLRRKFGRFRGRVSQAKYFLECWLWRRYNVIKIKTLPVTWSDPSEKMYHAIFAIFSEYMESNEPGFAIKTVAQSKRDEIEVKQLTALKALECKESTDSEAMDIWYSRNTLGRDQDLLAAYAWWREQLAKGWEDGPNILEFDTSGLFPTNDSFDDLWCPWAEYDRKYSTYDAAEKKWNEELDYHLAIILKWRRSLWT